MNRLKNYRRTLALASLCTAFAWSTPGWSQTIVRVEEDWVLLVNTPDADSVSPQVTCTMSPLNHINAVHATVELNHQSQPYFAPGGVQLQVWDGTLPVAARENPSDAVMRTNAETVSWTQVMEVKDGMLSFDVINGSSTTWGSFGGQGYLKHSMATHLTDLSGYSPLVSVEHSGAGYAQNRVDLLVLKQVRFVLSTGQVVVDSTYRVVHD